jgi:hypothetical protein
VLLTQEAVVVELLLLEFILHLVLAVLAVAVLAQQTELLMVIMELPTQAVVVVDVHIQYLQQALLDQADQVLSSFHTLVAKYSQAVLLHHLVEILSIRLPVVEV